MRIGRILIACLLIQGCVLHRDENPHNDVMLFGTTTSLGMQGGTDSTGTPKVNVGFDRTELVWMPLRPNGGSPNGEVYGAVVAACLRAAIEKSGGVSYTDEELENCLKRIANFEKYVGRGEGHEHSKGGEDTYSVFASFGGRGAVDGGPQASASGQLAQFFATGIAAQRLGSNSNIGYALNSASPEAKKLEAQDPLIVLAERTGRSPAELNTILLKAETENLDLLKRLNAVVPGCLEQDEKTQALKDIGNPEVTTLVDQKKSGEDFEENLSVPVIRTVLAICEEG